MFGVAYSDGCSFFQEQGLEKDARLSDIQGKPQEQTEKRVSEPPSKKQRISTPVTSTEKVPFTYHPSKGTLVYKRLVEAERLRAQSEKQRGDDLSKIAMMLAAGKNKDAGDVIPQSPPTRAADKSTSNATTDKSPSKSTSKQEGQQQSPATGRVARRAGGNKGVVRSAWIPLSFGVFTKVDVV